MAGAAPQFGDVPIGRLTGEQDAWLTLLEKGKAELYKEELAFETRAEDNITALSMNSQLLLGFCTGTNFILQRGSSPCTSGIEILFSIMPMISFMVGFGVAVTIAFKKLRRLNGPVEDLKSRQRDLHGDVMEFRLDLNAGNSPSGPDAVDLLRYTYRRRINAISGNKSEFAAFWPHYQKLVIWICIAAALYALTTIVATVAFSSGLWKNISGGGGGGHGVVVANGVFRAT